MLRQLLLALEFRHRNNIVHADVQPGKMLCPVNLHGLPEEHYHNADDPELEEEQVSNSQVRSEPILRRDGKLDRCATSHPTDDWLLVSYVRLGPTPTVKLSDLVTAFWLSDPAAKTATPTSFRALELILGEPFDHAIDMWSVGYLALGLVAGTPLFCVEGSRGPDTDNDHLVSLTAVLGEPLFQKWARADITSGRAGS
ncbi:MAG: hypothetical protein M1826_007080 [Phylliscum demangeonii]|nr:MAG: hypothetical protein M1826_007080 [Phylliscum demangeonii]